MLMRCVAPNLWGWLGDRTGQRLLIVRLGALSTLATFALIFFGKSYAWLALVMALHAFFWHAVLPQFEVITLAHLHGQTSRYSQVRLWGSIGFILTVVGLGRLFEWLSLDIYPVALVTIMAGIVAASLWVPNAQPLEQGERSGAVASCSSCVPRGAGVLRLRGADAAQPRAVLHLPYPAPGAPGLQPRCHRPAVGAGGSGRGADVHGHEPPVRPFQRAAGVAGQLPAGGHTLVVAGQPGR
jgi:PPP family 3-phenylpropionic acid transporter